MQSRGLNLSDDDDEIQNAPQPAGPSERALVGFAIRDARKLVDRAAAPAIGRWTWHAISRAAPDVHEALADQQRMLNEAYLEGDPEDIKRHSQAMARGWRIAYRAMSAADEPDDAYLVCECIATGDIVAVIRQKNPEPELEAAVSARVRAVMGEHAMVLAPHEVAAGLAGAAAVKREFPGAEVISLGKHKFGAG